MNNAFGRARRTRRPTINITSLIDVMFLLLIFFMVSSVFRSNAGIDITLPQATTAAEQQDAPIEILIEDSGAIVFDGVAGVTLAELEERMRALLAEDPEAKMALGADEHADYKDFVAIIDLARRLGGEHLIIRTEAQPANGDSESATSE